LPLVLLSVALSSTLPRQPRRLRTEIQLDPAAHDRSP
jgi:hypothetical protein